MPLILPGCALVGVVQRRDEVRAVIGAARIHGLLRLLRRIGIRSENGSHSAGRTRQSKGEGRDAKKGRNTHGKLLDLCGGATEALLTTKDIRQAGPKNNPAKPGWPVRLSRTIG